MNAMIEANYQAIKKEISSTVNELGLASKPRLIAVSKKKSINDISFLYSLGQRDFAENYLSELELKANSTSNLSEIKWHFIGQLQSNKIKKIVKYSSLIHSVCSLKHAKLINNYTRELNMIPKQIFIGVNLNNETTKSGVHIDKVDELANQIKSMSHLQLIGLMAIPSSEFEDSIFASLQELKESVPICYLDLVKKSRSIGEGKSSLGMSRDFKLAICAGSDFLRVGSSIFGERK